MAVKTKKKKKKGAREPFLKPEHKVAIRILLGLLALVVTVIVTASLVSYAFTWKADYSIKSNPEMWKEYVSTQNVCGKVGYLISDFLIGRLFGVGAYCIPFFLAAVTIGCFRIRRVRLLRCFLLCLMGAIVISLAASFVSGFWNDFVLSTGAGGSYGYYVNKWLTASLGQLGAGLVIGLLLILWLVLCSGKVALAIDNFIYKAFNRPRRVVQQEEAAVAMAEEAPQSDVRITLEPGETLLGEPEDEDAEVVEPEPKEEDEPEDVIDLAGDQPSSDVKITVEKGREHEPHDGGRRDGAPLQPASGPFKIRVPAHFAAGRL